MIGRDQLRDAAGRPDWEAVHRSLTARPRSELTGQELEALADAAWWLTRVDESVAVRQEAHAAYANAGDARRAGYNAWMLSSEYHFLGNATLAAGWLHKAERHLRDQPECVELGFLAYGQGEAAELRGELDHALSLARTTAGIGTRCASPDLVGMGLQLQGRLLVARGQRDEGLALLDEAMCDVMAGALSDLVTGWIYCIAVGVCFETAQLRRASEWNRAAMDWCATMPAGTPFHGLCRVHHVELIGLTGALPEADAEADRACAELTAYHPRTAAESFYVAGEIRRRRGDLAAAEEAFLRAHELGREPQPGLALLRLAQGRVEAAASALRSCLASGGGNPLSRARLLAGQVEVALAAGDRDGAREAARELAAISDRWEATLLGAMATTARGAVSLADGDVDEAAEQLRRARGVWLDLGLPYEAAQARLLLAAASRAVGDRETARLELRAARSVFERLGAAADLRRVDQLLGGGEPTPGGLSPREVEVLRLVAAGRTNRDIAAELVISPHTVARHLNNIFAKLGVSSRAAATAFAYTHEIVPHRGG